MKYLAIIAIALSTTACTMGSKGCYCVEGYVSSTDSIMIDRGE